MISEEKVILMTRMSIQADKLEKSGRRVNQYYRGDYIGFEIFRSFIAATVFCVMLFGSYALFNFNKLLDSFYSGGSIISELKPYIIMYFFVLIMYIAITYIIYSVRYRRMRKRIGAYYSDLKKLDNYYSTRGN